MTTNATLLNMDIADFLVQNDFNITISLDGPRNIHNKIVYLPIAIKGHLT